MLIYFGKWCREYIFNVAGLLPCRPTLPPLLQVCIASSSQKAVAIAVRLCISASNGGFINLHSEAPPKNIDVPLVQGRCNVTVKLVEHKHPPRCVYISRACVA